MKAKPLTTHPNLFKKSNAKGLLRVLVSAVVLAVNSWFILSPTSPILIVLLIGVNSFIMAGFFSVIHYCAHGTLFSSKWLNVAMGRLFGLPIMMNFSAYKSFHLQHHLHTSTPGDAEPAGKIRNVGQYFLFALNWDYLAAFMRLSVASVFNYFPFFVKNKTAGAAVKVNALLLLTFLSILIALAIGNARAVLLVYIVPTQIALIINFFLVIGEHYDLEPGEGVGTRTFATQCWAFNFFHYYSNYHAAHHSSPQIPPWNIGRVHDILTNTRESPAIGYSRFNWNLLQHLWKSPIKTKSATPEGREAHFFYKLKKST